MREITIFIPGSLEDKLAKICEQIDVPLEIVIARALEKYAQEYGISVPN